MRTLFADDPQGFPVIPVNPTPEESVSLADQVAEWLKQQLPESILVRLVASIESATKDSSDANLTFVLEWWNKLYADGLVKHGVRVEKPASEILEAWKAFRKSKTVQECLADLDLVRSEIERSSFVRKAGWFRLEKLLRGAKNKFGTPIVKILVEGGYRDGEAGLFDSLKKFAEAGD